jgi:hypothetical protein
MKVVISKEGEEKQSLQALMKGLQVVQAIADEIKGEALIVKVDIEIVIDAPPTEEEKEKEKRNA